MAEIILVFLALLQQIETMVVFHSNILVYDSLSKLFQYFALNYFDINQWINDLFLCLSTFRNFSLPSKK